MNKIDSFSGKYYFLSNFYPAKVKFADLEFNNNEAAFQAMKVTSSFIRKQFTVLPPNLAKRKGRSVRLRPDWENIKEDIMYRIVYAKFSQNEGLKRKLIATGNLELIEGNTWNDTTWGVCNGKGQNKLGKILMKVRDELK